MNLTAYYSVLLFFLVGTGLGVMLIAIGKFLGPNRPDSRKNSPYECGFDVFENARMKFDVRYYFVAILFIIFDLETAFLFPWGVSLRDIGWPGFISMIIFLLEFLIGFAYVWKKGGLDWE
ncbi:MAG: NADH-quinone oxidoreductase subunit A [Burkholderia sp.]|nr:NADH-quinone oxidoreductase subunit A [Burkholderia sp.]